MKLYASVTSERAIKGQGGNDFLNIIIKGDRQEEIARIVVTESEENGYIISYDYDEDVALMERWKQLELAETKGEKQKGDSYDDITHLCTFNACKNVEYRNGVCKKHFEQGLA